MPFPAPIHQIRLWLPPQCVWIGVEVAVDSLGWVAGQNYVQIQNVASGRSTMIWADCTQRLDVPTLHTSRLEPWTWIRAKTDNIFRDDAAGDSLSHLLHMNPPGHDTEAILQITLGTMLRLWWYRLKLYPAEDGFVYPAAGAAQIAAPPEAYGRTEYWMYVSLKNGEHARGQLMQALLQRGYNIIAHQRWSCGSMMGLPMDSGMT